MSKIGGDKGTVVGPFSCLLDRVLNDFAQLQVEQRVRSLEGQQWRVSELLVQVFKFLELGDCIPASQLIDEEVLALVNLWDSSPVFRTGQARTGPW